MCKGPIAFVTIFLVGVITMSHISAAPLLVEKIERSANPYLIPYEKYQFPNGLTVILQPDHSNPLVHVDMTYHVGSARESFGRSGYAHLFEHMMFEGSKHVAHGEHFRIITEAGGTLNGSTSRDRTNYYETLPKNYLETALWLESDRMGFFLEALSQEKFEVQRETVKNERAQRYDNQPYGLVWERLSEALYPPTHPYAWLPIGYVSDLDKATLDDIKQFFNRFYGPNNAVLTIGGDFSVPETLALIEKYFGDITAAPTVAKAHVQLPILTETRKVTLEDPLIKVPQLVITFPGVSAFDHREPALDCLAYLLGEGQGSILYKALVQSQIAVDASAFNDTSELSGEFVISAMGYSGQSLTPIYNALETLIHEKGLIITQDMVDRFKAKMRRRFVSSIESVESRVRKLALYETLFKTPNLMATEAERYESLEVIDVQNAYNAFIRNKPRVLLSVVPASNPEISATSPNFTLSDRPKRSDEAALPLRSHTSAFNRATQPTPEAAPTLNPVVGEKRHIGNDIPVVLHKSDKIPLVKVAIQFKGGQWLADTVQTSPAVGRLLEGLLDEDSQVRDAETYHQTLDKLGSSVSWDWGREFFTIDVVSFPDTFNETMALLSDQLIKPAFKEADLNRLKLQLYEELKYKDTVPSEIADETIQEWLYGTQSALSGSLDGTPADVEKVKVGDIQGFYTQQFQQKLASVVIVGSLPKEGLDTITTLLEQFPEGQNPLSIVEPKSNTPSIVIVDTPGSVQTEIRLGYMAMPYDGLGDFYKSSIMNFLLGGTFNSRLNMKLREEKAFTYGAFSYFSGAINKAPYMVNVAVKASATGEAVQDIFSILNAYQETPLTEEELTFTKRAILQREALRYETYSQKATFLSRMQTFDLPTDIQEQRSEWLQTVPPDTLLELAKAMPIKQMSLILVGDKKIIEPQIKALNLNLPIEIR
jgi:zinc protease